MISAITEYAQNSPQLALYTEHMNMLMMDTDSTLNEFRQAVLEKYKRHSPRMLILLGNSSMILRDDFRKMWEIFRLYYVLKKITSVRRNFISKRSLLS